MRFANPHTRGQLAIVLVFAVLIVAPAIAFAFGANRGNENFIVGAERRTVATMPPQSELLSHTGSYTRSVEQVIADAFPLRTSLIEGYDWTKFALLGDSSSEQVLRGREGWLFYGAPEVRASITGSVHPSDVDLDYLVQVYQGRADFCRAHHARYVVVFAPEKSSIYPEYLPAGIALLRPTTLDRLVPRLRAAGVVVADVVPAILAAKKRGEVYSRGETHWNGRGAYAASVALADALRSSGVKPIPAGAIQEQVHERGGDLLAMSGVGRLIQDRQIDIALVQRAKRVATPEYAGTEPSGDPLIPYATVVDDQSLPTAVVFGDSFGYRLFSFVDESFRRVLHVPVGTQPFNEHLIFVERPDVVIDELVERSLTLRQIQ